jgi:hypothetical protein
MSATEVVERGVMAARQRLDRWSWHARQPRWNRSRVASAIARDSPLSSAVPLLARGDARGAHRLISAHFAERPQRFLIGPQSRDRVARLIRARFPNAQHEARQVADDAARGSVDVLGYRRLSFVRGPRQPIDWSWDPVHDRRAPEIHWSSVAFLDPGVGDHKIIWELNRHQHWMKLGRAYWLTDDQRYREAFVEQLQGWMAANPPRTGINWASMLELGLRAISWIWVLHLFASRPSDAGPDTTGSEPAWSVDLLLGIQAQLTLVEHHLSTHFSPNTHLLGEALALYVAGRSLPELRASHRWTSTGRRILLAEAIRQVHPDGGHVELSTHYHRYALDFFNLALAMARITDDAAAVEPFTDVVGRLAGFARALSDRHYRLPQIGDDDGGMLFTLCGGEARDVGPALAVSAALLGDPELGDERPHEESAWIVGDIPITPARKLRRSVILPDSGYVVSRTSRGDHLVMDVGPLGYLNGGHAHADALSLTLSVAGHPLLIDPGTGAYTIDCGLRDRFRSTAAHNTLMLDGRSQSEPAGPFHWRSQASARLEACQLGPDVDVIEASHDGYGVASHRRQVLSRPGCWVVIDWVAARGTSSVAAHWHVDPTWRVRDADRGRIALTHTSGMTVWMLTSVDVIEAHTDVDDVLAWYAPSYGVVQAATTLRVGLDAATPFALVTTFVESRTPSMTPLTNRPPAGPTGEPLAFRIHGDGWQDTVVAAGPTMASVDGTAYGISGQGRVLYARTVAPLGQPRAALAASR